MNWTRLLPPFLRRFLRRVLEHALDGCDTLYRKLKGQSHLPSRTLRMRVGGTRNFNDIGPWFLADFRKWNLIRPGQKILDVGCGCGRVALSVAADPELKDAIAYVGMDVDGPAIRWCQKHITPRLPNFTFYHLNVHNGGYNPDGNTPSAEVTLPHPDNAFDFVFLVSVFTNFAPDGLERYLGELRRILKPGGDLYISMYVYNTEAEAVEGVSRHSYKFKHYHGQYAVMVENRPEGGIAYQRGFFVGLAEKQGLYLKRPVIESMQDILIFGKTP